MNRYKMSTPTASLKKTRRSPLPTRGLPFRKDNSLPSLSPLKEGASLNPSDHTSHRHILEGIRNEGRVPKDADLVTSMATRLATVERELLAAKREIIEKDNYIRRLEERLSSLQTTSTQEQLELQCQALQQQVDEMEEFLNDYGMVWIGQDTSNSSPFCSPLTHATSWYPKSSLPSELSIDFDCILRNVKELNILAGEDSAQIMNTPTGAKLTVPDPIPLTLYKNGFLMFNGPFRPYTDPTTQQCVQDLMDGYFPTELQHRFPEGVPFKINDKRSEEYQRPRHHVSLFPGIGEKLGEQSHSKPTVYPHQSTVTMETFFSHLPKTVIRKGRVIDIHGELTETLQGTGNEITLINTPVVEEIKQRLQFNEEERPHTPGKLTTLRIRSETGDKMYILKMQTRDTIGDIYKHLNKIRSPSCGQEDYILKASFPRRVLTNMDATLYESGLCPSANLFISQSITHKS